MMVFRTTVYYSVDKVIYYRDEMLVYVFYIHLSLPFSTFNEEFFTCSKRRGVTGDTGMTSSRVPRYLLHQKLRISWCLPWTRFDTPT